MPRHSERLPALAGVGVGVFVIAYDFTGLNIAIPRIEGSLGTSIATAQWVLNGYALAFGVFIVTAGRLADLFGRKRLFLLGGALFAASSTFSGLAQDVGVLIAVRCVMGVGAAMMWPAAVGMMYALLPATRAGLAGGLTLGIAGVGNALGPVAGGAIVEVASWRWVFLLNLPVTALAMLAVWRAVPATRGGEHAARIDYRGMALLSAGLVALLLALDEGIDAGFGAPPILGLFAAALLLMAAFAGSERRAGSSAVVPPTVVANRVFAAAVAAAVLVSAIFSGALFYLPQFMAKTLDFSAFESGVGLLPVMAVFALTAFAAGPLFDRIGAKAVVSAGAACLGLGILVLSFLDGTSTYASLVPGMLVLGVGMGLFYSSTTTVAVTALGSDASSLASGIVYMCQVAGGAVGLGVNTAVAATASDLPAGIASAFRVDAALALVGLAVVLAFVTDAPRRSTQTAARAELAS
jgi:EmrB/QacA subfamily drug resistance transporter